jgi:hypothetical protein
VRIQSLPPPPPLLIGTEEGLIQREVDEPAWVATTHAIERDLKVLKLKSYPRSKSPHIC